MSDGHLMFRPNNTVTELGLWKLESAEGQTFWCPAPRDGNVRRTVAILDLPVASVVDTTVDTKSKFKALFSDGAACQAGSPPAESCTLGKLLATIGCRNRHTLCNLGIGIDKLRPA